MQSPAPADLAARLSAHSRIARLLEALADEPSAHLVGGAVRDLLLELDRDRADLDLDVVVEGDAAEVAREAAERLSGSVRVHHRFNTATVSAADLTFDVAGARRESYERPGALPQVDAATLDEDLARRDFSVNAMAVALAGPEPGSLRTVAGALDDLEAHRLRVLHDESFRDDPTRLLRLVRYAGRLGFAIEAHTRELAEQAIVEGALRTVSGPRIGVELALVLREPEAVSALVEAAKLGLDRALHPGFEVRPELFGSALELLPADGRPEVLGVAVCATGFERADLRAWLNDLGWPAPERDAAVVAALDAPAVARALETAERPSQLAQAARGKPAELVAHAGALGPRQAASRALSFRGWTLEISGDDLVAAGVPEGPDVGRALAAALEAKLDGEARGRDAELAAALHALEP
jgi:tRNA nucleotidyltransferase (CCA-adding enzyme)